MGSTTVSYTATSLADIAENFEIRAKHIRKSRETSKPNSRAWRTLTTEAQVWDDAAYVLRRTTIVPMPPITPWTDEEIEAAMSRRSGK